MRRVDDILAWLQRRGTRRNRDGMARYGIRSAKTFGVSMATMRPLVKRLGRDHDLALALWDTGWLEARVLAAFVDEPLKVTPRQMETWAAGFDNWAVCDSVCLHLFDRTPHAWSKTRVWSRRRAEFVRRAAFATLAGLAVHDTRAPDARFLASLPLIAAAAGDDRNFVKKAVNWALRQIGKRNLALHQAAVELSARLTARPEPSARWIGRDARRELTSSAVRQRLARRAQNPVLSRSVSAP
jgi:3-methyladenine DNA glycosylase AlkD